MGLFDSIAGGLINSALGKFNASNQAKIQNAQAKYINTHKHQWEVQDLRAAGLNPILSATNGMGYANAGGVSVSSSDNGLGSAETSSNTALKLGKETNRISEKSVDNQKEMIDSNISKNEADIENNSLSTAANVNLTNTSVEQLKHQIMNNDAITAATIEKLRMDAESNRISAGASATTAYHMGRMTDSNIEHNTYKNRNLGANTDYTGSQNTFLRNSKSPYFSDYGKSFGYVDYGVGKIGDVVSIAGHVKDLLNPLSGAASSSNSAYKQAYKTVTRYYD